MEPDEPKKISIKTIFVAFTALITLLAAYNTVFDFRKNFSSVSDNKITVNLVKPSTFKPIRVLVDGKRTEEFSTEGIILKIDIMRKNTAQDIEIYSQNGDFCKTKIELLNIKENIPLSC